MFPNSPSHCPSQVVRRAKIVRTRDDDREDGQDLAERPGRRQNRNERLVDLHAADLSKRDAGKTL
jgi:hypothetical protein